MSKENTHSISYMEIVRDLGESSFSELRWATAKKFRVYHVVNGN